MLSVCLEPSLEWIITCENGCVYSEWNLVLFVVTFWETNEVSTVDIQPLIPHPTINSSHCLCSILALGIIVVTLDIWFLTLVGYKNVSLAFITSLSWLTGLSASLVAI